ncbi:hypothetical protein [Microbacterium sp.]|uniref:hypothetical protein n=1 Tax=Microbacterium sp. TaxID=51671 RepID=UPI00334116EA
MSDSRDTAAGIEEAIRAVPGVASILRTGNPVANVLDAGARALGIRDEEAPLVRVASTPEGVEVEAAIAVRPGTNAADTAREVFAAVTTVVAEQGGRAADVRITVAHVGDAVTQD